MNWSKCLRFSAFFALALLVSAATVREGFGQDGASERFGIVMHGGAGSITPDGLGSERQAAYRAKLQEALHAAFDVLNQGGSSLDAVVAAITIMEDSPLFNAGRGAVLTNAGTAELDASIMDGKTRNAGAAASVKRVKNPILLARHVMEESRHVMLIADGAEAFAEEQGLEMVSNEYFRTPRRIRQYERYRQRAEDDDETGDAGQPNTTSPSGTYGTVGAAALDRDGNLAAGTSTGGISFKRWGRVGDSPISVPARTPTTTRAPYRRRATGNILSGA